MGRAVSFQVVGEPAGQGSKIPGQRKDGSLYVREASKKTMPYRELAEWAAVRARPTGHKPMTNVVCHVWIYMLRPPSHYFTGGNSHVVKPTSPRYPTVKPDIDKIERLLFDSLSKARIIKDDAHIIECHVYKRYADLLEPVGISCTVEELEEP